MREFLEKYGQINLCFIVNTNSNKTAEFPQQPLEEIAQPTEQEKIGLVLFERREDALTAIKDLNGKIVDSSLKPLIITL